MHRNRYRLYQDAIAMVANSIKLAISSVETATGKGPVFPLGPVPPSRHIYKKWISHRTSEHPNKVLLHDNFSDLVKLAVSAKGGIAGRCNTGEVGSP